jgi:hypothetical protein
MADNKAVRDGDNAPFQLALDELGDASFSPKHSLVDGTGSPTPISPATSGKQDETKTLIGAVTETAPATDTASSGLNGRLQRIAQRITSLIALFPSALGQTTKTASLSVALASNDDSLALLGSVTETAPASDTASSGHSGRMQRIAQRLTSLIALFPSALGGTTAAASFPVVLSSDGPFATQTGSVTETAPASDTASSGLNGRLQRIAQRLTSLIALFPSALGQTTKTASLSVALASNDDSLALLGAVTETAPATDTASSGHNGRLQRIAQRITTLIALVPAALTGSGNFKVSIAESTATVTTKETRSSTGTASAVASSASSVTILVSNANRLGASVFNDSTQVLYLLLGSATASATVYSVQLLPGAYFEVPANYTGQLTGIWASANGNARVTELT